MSSETGRGRGSYIGRGRQQQNFNRGERNAPRGRHTGGAYGGQPQQQSGIGYHA